ncbi:MAG: o-succinylbenzoate synthase [Bacteroidetes bacterium]|jgi:O-succinylbenzoate synthase|nr:o-succinylbenzoate synthase [Bacteroidota bacterium]
MLKANFQHHPMIFKRPAGTSRGVLLAKDSWLITLTDGNDTSRYGIGEASIIPGLSIDPPEAVEAELTKLCKNIASYPVWLETHGTTFPAIRFALETALHDMNYGGNQIFGETAFTKGEAGITINGLIWMGDAEFMKAQLLEKIKAGFNCIKLKIGALDFEKELALLASIRSKYDADEIEIRLDANGAFAPDKAMNKLEQLAQFNIHSIEQPIKAGQRHEMAALCERSPIPIALDEELIGIHQEAIPALLAAIKPQYIILKPSLIGGLEASEHWIEHAEKQNMNWWATSALESNIGLNAIAQWVYKKQNPLPQGLGTGQLFSNNIASPLEIRDAKLFHNPKLQ